MSHSSPHLNLARQHSTVISSKCRGGSLMQCPIACACGQASKSLWSGQRRRRVQTPSHPEKSELVDVACSRAPVLSHPTVQDASKGGFSKRCFECLTRVRFCAKCVHSQNLLKPSSCPVGWIFVSHSLMGRGKPERLMDWSLVSR